MLNMMTCRSLQRWLQQEMSGSVKHDVNRRCLAMLNMMSTGDDWQC
jgi:hypothetical protein